MLQRLIFLLFILPVAFNAIGQRSEAGFFAGGSYYIGDLNPNKHFLLTKPAGGIFWRQNINSRFAFKANLYMGRIAGDDALSGFNSNRNLNFRSNIYDFSALVEFNFFPYKPGDNSQSFTPFVFAGYSAFHFNPQGELANDIPIKGKPTIEKGWYDLQPLGTEGQGNENYPERKTYSRISHSLPFGLGVKYCPFGTTTIALEYTLHHSSTDYIDDVSTTYANPKDLAPLTKVFADKSAYKPTDLSANRENLQRGNSRSKDWYAFIGITISMRINFSGSSCPAYTYNTIKKNYSETHINT